MKVSTACIATGLSMMLLGCVVQEEAKGTQSSTLFLTQSRTLAGASLYRIEDTDNPHVICYVLDKSNAQAISCMSKYR